VGTGLQVPELQWPEPDTLQLEDRMPDGVAHALDLPLAALVNGDLQLVGLEAGHPGRGGATVLEVHPLSEGVQGPLVDRRVGHPHPVGLVDLEARVGQAVGERAVVGEQDEPAGVDVQAPDGVQAARSGHERDHGGPPMRIAGRGDDPRGLVEQVHDRVGGGRHRPAVHRDLVLIGLDVRGRIGDRRSVDLDPLGADDLLRGPAGGHSG
jgi:hypothetical protein